MRNSRWMDGAHSAMAELWQWHAIEETEHKSVAYIYRDDFHPWMLDNRELLRKTIAMQG